MPSTTFFNIILLCGISISGVWAKPYTPQHADDIVAQLPLSKDPDRIKLQQLRASLSQQPKQLSVALHYSYAALRLAQRHAEPRFYGYIKAALEPWWQQTPMPSEVQLLRAIIAQSQHHFKLALIDLHVVLKQQPHNAHARLVKALILYTQGKYQQAKQACTRLILFSDHLTSTLCIVQVTSANGQARKGRQLLLKQLRQTKQTSPRLQLWGWTLLAEISQRLNEPQLAEEYYKKALQWDDKDHYLNVAYADFLLETHRYQDIINRYSLPLSNPLLVRLAFAEKALEKPIFRQHQLFLKQRFATEQQQNDRHWRDYALYLLLREQPQQALSAAITHWQTQRQPEDTLLVYRAALAAKQPQAIETIAQWFKQQKLEDYRIQSIANSLKIQ